MKTNRKTPLKTDFECDLHREKIPFSDYPRPSLKRSSYFCLNGEWDFWTKEKETVSSRKKILVPFPPESRLSGIEKSFGKETVLFYERTFTLPENFINDRVFLHFGAVDQSSEVFINGQKVGENHGGYLPFFFDITPYLKNGENKISVQVKDPLDRKFPYGKQTEKPSGMWYTSVSGIWQTVWLESVPKNHIKNLKIVTTDKEATIFVNGGEEKKKLILHGFGSATEYHFSGNCFKLSLPNGKMWSPEEPNLYSFSILSGEDRVESYFALRKISVEKIGETPLLFLNGKPYYFHGVLDQGYFPDGIFLPASSRGYREDILKMKKCGFNLLRKHIKLEPEIFYYECDRLGIAIFQDMINNGKYSFFRDTLLPTLGIKKGIRVKRTKEEKEEFLKTCIGIQKVLHNHPSVLYYTIFNEGWGQFDSDFCYDLLKKEDPSRICDTTSGWFFETKSDVDSHHIYFKKLKLPIPSEKPAVLSEFGGFSCKIKGHSFLDKGEYGYRFFKDKKEWAKAIETLYEKEVLPLAEKGLCATVLTQLSDVEEETNGILTYDRKITKAEPEKFFSLAKKIKDAFYKNFPCDLK
ncbi:MAG: glycoside hydrolase family 2 [Clostridia bacterium]|nr:glycoside hydrolase family 2 [Clostridia bacterium]